jgi:hypothetical protein
MKAPSKTQIAQILSSCKVDPRNDPILNTILATAGVTYPRDKAIELITSSRYTMTQHEQCDVLRQAIQFIALHIAQYETPEETKRKTRG